VRGWRRPRHRRDHHGDEQADQQQLGQGAGPDPARRHAEHGQQQGGRDGGAGQIAATGQGSDVTGADQAHDRRAGDDPGQEPPAGHRASPVAQPGRGVAGCTRRAWHRLAQAREHRGQDGGQGEQAGPGQDGGRSGLRGGQAGQQEQPGSEQGADVEGRGPRHGEREGLCG
jgi:hypothetical protein